MSDNYTPPAIIDDELQTRLFHQRVIVLGDQLDQKLGNWHLPSWHLVHECH